VTLTDAGENAISAICTVTSCAVGLVELLVATGSELQATSSRSNAAARDRTRIPRVVTISNPTFAVRQRSQSCLSLRIPLVGVE